MDLSLTNEQEQLVDAFDALYSRLATPERVRAAEPLGFDSDLWRTLVDAGVVEMAVDEQAGGWGASVLDLALVAERHGRAVAPAPLIETQIAAFALAQCDDDAGRTPLQAVLSGKHIISFAPRPGRGDVLSLVPGGAVADAVVAFVDGRLLLVSLKTRRRPPPINNLAAMPLSDVAIPDDVSVLAEGECAAQVYGAALDRWLALTALALVGIAGRAVEMGSEYAKQRSAFDVPIGKFQAVSHPLADSATAVDGARLLGLEAACAFADEPQRAAELAAMAFVFAYETARDATHRSLHIHGGYGFGMEQDIQLYYRRARGWALVYAEPSLVLDRVAEMRYGPAKLSPI